VAASKLKALGMVNAKEAIHKLRLRLPPTAADSLSKSHRKKARNLELSAYIW
jgi:hypothetical protein